MSGYEKLDTEMHDVLLASEAFPMADQDTFDELMYRTFPDQWRPSNEFPTPQSVGKDQFSIVANDALSFSGEQARYRLGEPSLPVSPYRNHVLETYMRSRNMVLSSPTGSGKSTQTGLWLLEAGAPKVYITQPRIVAARELLGQARKSLGPDHAHLAGYLTGNADDSDCSPDARLVYVTEDLMYKMINRGQIKPNEVVMLDEAHERGTGMIFMLHRLRKMQPEIPGLGIIIASATIETEKFAKYLGDPVNGGSAPIIELPGRTFPVERKETDRSVAEVMRQEIGDGKNVIAFEPGRARIVRTSSKAQPRKTEGSIHQLYGDQTPAEQKAALIADDGHHIVGSRVAETSLTPNGKDTAVDSGLSNVGRYHAGVRAIETVWSSQDTINQRAGRVGRTKPGTHYLAQPDEAPPAPSFDERQAFETPPIENTSVTRYLIEEMLGGEGVIDPNELFESPTAENLAHDYKILHRLGALATVGAEVVLTPVGEQLSNLPLDAHLGRMIVEARQKPIDDPEFDRDALVLQTAAAAAVQTVNGILDVGQYSARRFLRTMSGKERLSNEQLSDLLFELDVFSSLFQKHQAALADPRDGALQAFNRLLISRDIIPVRFEKARRTFVELCRRLNLDPADLHKPEGDERRMIIECQLAGAEELFVRKTKMLYQDIRGERRQTGRKSVIARPLAQIIMGIPFEIRGMRATGRANARRLIVGGSAVSLEQLRAILPHRLSEASAGYAISRKGKFVEKKTFFFDNELEVGSAEEAPSPTIETRVALITAMMTGVGNSSHNIIDPVAFVPGTPNATEAIRRWQEAQRLQHRSGKNLNAVKRYESLIRKVVSESLLTVSLDVVDPDELDVVIPKVYLSSIVHPKRQSDIPEIIKQTPDAISIAITEDKKEYIAVTYRNNIAYVTLTREQMYMVSRGDFAKLCEYRHVKLRIGTEKYHQFDDAFKMIEQKQLERVEKQERRERKRELAATALPAVIATDGMTQRERTDIQDAVEKVKVKSYDKRLIGRQKRRAARMLIRSTIPDIG